MQSGSVAKRYANAFISLTGDASQTENALKELEIFEQYLQRSEELRQVLTNPSFAAHKRVAVLRDLLAAARFGELTNRFLLLLAQKRRMDIFGDVLRELKNIYDRQQGLIQVSVTSAVPLSPDLEKQLVSQIERLVKRKVVLTRRVDPKILGGIVTRVGDLLFDGSLSTQLARMKSVLLQEQLS